MKILYLVRHAKAVSRRLPIPDFDRPLSKRGRQDAHVMTQAAQAHGPAPDVIVSSPAPRALETAQIFATAYRYPVKRLRTHAALYEEADAADAATLLHFLHALDDTCQTAMLFGHEPLWSACVRFFDPAFTTPIPTGAVTGLRFDAAAWRDLEPASGTVIWFQTPSMVRPKRQPSHAPDPAALCHRFDLPQGWQWDEAVRALQEAYPIQRDRRFTEHAVYYDTCDWRLFNKSLILAYTPHQARLYALPDERLVSQTDMTAPPVRLHDLPPGNLHTRLAPILDVRALLPLVDLTSRYQPLRLVDDRDKTVLRLTVEQHAMGQAPGAPPLVSRVCLHPLKGYDKAAKKLRRWLVQQAFTPCHNTLYELALHAVDKTPNAYVTKPRLQLDPNMRADEATKQILRFLLGVMRRNEAGIIDDTDTEFLHDFRVAMRRARSALSQIKGVFSAPATQRLKTQLAWLGSITNRVRDLDVYLLKEESYKAELSELHRDAIDPLFALLRQERAKAHVALVRKLHTQKYRDILERWDTFLAAPCNAAPETAPAASRPILKVARKRLKKRGRAVVELGMSLRGSDDAKGLHALRIECKKLRYLLEFFDSLFPEDEVTPLVRQLRKLQDNLGDFHDLCVQQADLHTFAARLATSQPQNPDILLAIGGLITILEAKKARLRETFPDTFAAFVTAYEKVTF